MALRLSGVIRWCITGTPIQRTFDGQLLTTHPSLRLLLYCYHIHAPLKTLTTHPSLRLLLYCYHIHAPLKTLTTHPSLSLLLYCYHIHAPLKTLTTHPSLSLLLYCYHIHPPLKTLNQREPKRRQMLSHTCSTQNSQNEPKCRQTIL